MLKKCLTPMKMKISFSQVADGTVKISGGDQRLRASTLIRRRPERGEEQEIPQGESGGLSPSHIEKHTYIVGCVDGKHIDDHWNVDGDRELSDTWTGFTRFTHIEKETARTGFCVQGETDEKTNDL